MKLMFLPVPKKYKPNMLYTIVETIRVKKNHDNSLTCAIMATVQSYGLDRKERSLEVP